MTSTQAGHVQATLVSDATVLLEGKPCACVALLLPAAWELSTSCGGLRSQYALASMDNDNQWLVHAAGLRKLAAVAPAQAEAAGIANAAWLEDVVMHLLCVLALDRFADYVSDQV